MTSAEQAPATIVHVPTSVAPSRNVTVPSATPGLTVAVSVTGLPYVELANGVEIDVTVTAERWRRKTAPPVLTAESDIAIDEPATASAVTGEPYAAAVVT